MTALAVGVSKEHITKTPGVCGGKACIAGTRIRVMDVVVRHEHRKESPNDIADSFPGITPADVHAALTYYHDNRSEIEDDFRKAKETAEWFKTHFPSKVRGRMSD